MGCWWKKKAGNAGVLPEFLRNRYICLTGKPFPQCIGEELACEEDEPEAYKASFTVIITELTAVKTIIYIYILQIEK